MLSWLLCRPANFSIPRVGPDFHEVLFLEAPPADAEAVVAQQRHTVCMTHGDVVTLSPKSKSPSLSCAPDLLHVCRIPLPGVLISGCGCCCYATKFEQTLLHAHLYPSPMLTGLHFDDLPSRSVVASRHSYVAHPPDKQIRPQSTLHR